MQGINQCAEVEDPDPGCADFKGVAGSEKHLIAYGRFGIIFVVGAV